MNNSLSDCLSDQVNHLEMSNACMADDILNKASIIEHYVMESRSGELRMKVFSFDV